jgi:hypothetical protein
VFIYTGDLPGKARTIATTITAPKKATIRVLRSNPVNGSGIPSKLAARKPPTNAPIIPKTMLKMRPRPLPFIIVSASHPATRPTKIHARIPMIVSFDKIDIEKTVAREEAG